MEAIDKKLRVELTPAIVGGKRYIEGNVEDLRSFAIFLTGLIDRIPKGAPAMLWEVFPPQRKTGKIRPGGPDVELRLCHDHANDSYHWMGCEPGCAVAGEECHQTEKD